MPHTLRLVVGAGHSKDELLQALEQYANDELLPILPDLENIGGHSGGVLDDGSVELNDVTHVGGTTYRLHYSFTWSCQMGCSDRSIRGEKDQRANNFEYIGDTAVFRWEEAPERFPNDEL